MLRPDQGVPSRPPETPQRPGVSRAQAAAAAPAEPLTRLAHRGSTRAYTGCKRGSRLSPRSPHPSGPLLRPARPPSHQRATAPHELQAKAVWKGQYEMHNSGGAPPGGTTDGGDVVRTGSGFPPQEETPGLPAALHARGPGGAATLRHLSARGPAGPVDRTLASGGGGQAGSCLWLCARCCLATGDGETGRDPMGICFILGNEPA